MRAVVLVRRAADLPLVGAATALGETTALAATPDDDATRALMTACQAAGAARLIRVWDPSLEAADYLGVAYVLAAAVRAIVGDLAASPTVILAGDRGRNCVGPAVAERLGVPLLGQALSLDEHDGKLRVQRRSRALVRTLSAAPPALVCVIVDDSTPPQPHSGEGAESESWSLSKVGMSAAELAYRRRFAPGKAPAPHPPSPPLRLPDAAALVARLRADGLVPSRKPRPGSD